MAGMQIRPIADFSPAPVIPQVRSVAPPSVEGADASVKAPEKTEQAQELENVIAKSKDGDTVQVSENSAEKLSEDAFGRMDIIGRDTDQEDNGTVVDAQVSAIASEADGRNADEKVIPNISAAVAAPAPKPEIETSEDKEKEEEAVKAVESDTDDQPKITSFAGYTEDQLKQMYQKGEISKRDFDKQMELKESLKEETQGDDSETSKMVQGVLGLENVGKQEAEELKTVFSEDTSDRISTEQRIAVMDALEKNVLGI